MDAAHLVYFRYVSALGGRGIDLLDDPSLCEDERETRCEAVDWGAHLTAGRYLADHPVEDVSAAPAIFQDGVEAPVTAHARFFHQLIPTILQFIREHDPLFGDNNALEQYESQ